MRQSSGAPEVDTEALLSSYNTDATGARRSGQGEVPSRSLGSNYAVPASGICCRPFSTRFSSTQKSLVPWSIASGQSWGAVTANQGNLDDLVVACEQDASIARVKEVITAYWG